MARLVEEFAPAVAVLDGMAGLLHGASSAEVTSMVAREIYLLKTHAITTMATTLARDEESSTVSVSSLVDTWLLLRNVESNGERNRLLFVLKSRGTPHSNQVREFILTDHGVDLIDVYVGPEGVLTGSARLVQEAKQRTAARRDAEELHRRRRDLHRDIAERETQLRLIQDDIASAKAELERIDEQEQGRTADVQAGQAALADRRWADPKRP
jgi:circadian clock protein KaiC